MCIQTSWSKIKSYGKLIILPRHIYTMKGHFALHYCVCNIPSLLLFLLRRNSPSGSGPPHCRGFKITLRYTTLGRTLLTELSARRRDLHLTTHNTHKRQTYKHPAGFEPTVPASERSQTHALDRAATGIDSLLLAFSYMNTVRSLMSYTF